MQFILSLGSNHNAVDSLQIAKKELMKRFPDIRFTSSITSPSVDIDSDDFTNCLASGSTILGYDEMKTLMKNIEQIAGDRKELRKVRCVVMDIDILMFGHKKCHTSDWDRKYVKTLMKQL